MYLITCQHKDCPTPHFYVDPQGGKIALNVSIDTSGIQLADVRSGVSENDQKIDRFLKSIDKELSELTSQEKESIKKKLHNFISAAPLSTLPIIEPVKDAMDYLIVECQSNHKNYIVIK